MSSVSKTPRQPVAIILLLSTLGMAGCEARTVPVSVSFYPRTDNRGLIAEFTNHSDRHLDILLAFENQTLGQANGGHMVLPPHSSDVTGDGRDGNGWIFMSGETITIAQDGYETKTVRVP